MLIFLAGLVPATYASGIREVREPRIEEVSPFSNTPLPKDPLLIEGKLPNGLSYYIRRNLKPENRAELRLVVNAGSVLEEDDQQGLAHFVEHMAFNGTARFPKNSLVNWLESIGMRFGPETNAYTSFDETVYQLEVPLDDPRILDTALDILYDWAFGMTLAEDDIEKERGVILEEWRLGRGASSRVRDRQYPTLWKGSRYAERLPIGKPPVIQGAPPEALRRFYKDWYRPDLMAIVAVGDFYPAEIEKRIREKFSLCFSGQPAPPPSPSNSPKLNPRPRPVFSVPDHEDTLVSVATDPELPYSSVGIYLKQDPTVPRTFAEYRQELIENLFFSVLNSRFSDLSRKPGAPFLFAGAGSAHPIRAKKLLYVSASAEEGGIQKALEGILTELRRIQLYGVSAQEVERAKAEIQRQAEQRAREQYTLSSSTFVRSYVDAYLRGTPTMGPVYAFRVVTHLLNAISPAEVAGLAQPFLEPANRVILVSAPEKERPRLPKEEDLLALAEDAAKAIPTPYTEEAALTQLLEPGTPKEEGTLVRIKGPVSERYSAVEWRLGNGARVVLKHTDFKADELLFSAFSLGGTSLAEDEYVLSATFSSDVIEQSGLGNFSSSQIEKYLSGKLVSLSPRIDEVALRFNGSSSRKDLETFFQLLYLYFTSPRYDEGAITRYLDQVRTSLSTQENSPEERYRRMIQETLKSGHPRSLPLTAERLSQVDPKKAYAFYRSLVSRPDTFTFVFVGSVKPEELEPYLKRYLAVVPVLKKGIEGNENKAPSQTPGHEPIPPLERGADGKSAVQGKPAGGENASGGSPGNGKTAAHVPSAERESILWEVVERAGSLIDRGVRFRTESVQKVLKAGKEPRSFVTLYFTGGWDWSLDEMSYLNLLEDYLDIRLREVLREDRGGTYGVNVSITPRRAPVPEYSIEVSFGTAPTRVEELLGILHEELEKLKTTPPLDSDVAKVKEQRFRLLERGRKENGFWRYFLTQELYYEAVDRVQGIQRSGESRNRGTLFDLWEQTARSLTPQMLQERIKNYFVENRMLRFILEPEDRFLR